MTIEQILGIKDPLYLEKMSSDELLGHFKIYLDVTRPERAATNRKVTGNSMTAWMDNPTAKAGLDLCKQLGIDIAGALAPVRKKK